jgi:hypothetical protein
VSRVKTLYHVTIVAWSISLLPQTTFFWEILQCHWQQYLWIDMVSLKTRKHNPKEQILVWDYMILYSQIFILFVLVSCVLHGDSIRKLKRGLFTLSIVESYACLWPLILFFCLSYVILFFYVCMFVSSIKSLFFVFFLECCWRCWRWSWPCFCWRIALIFVRCPDQGVAQVIWECNWLPEQVAAVPFLILFLLGVSVVIRYNKSRCCLSC